MPAGDYWPRPFEWNDATGFTRIIQTCDPITIGKAYREFYGEPVENLAILLSSLADSETWNEVINDPDVYGSEE